MAHRTFNIAGLTTDYQELYALMLATTDAIPTDGILPDRVNNLVVTPADGNTGDVLYSDRNSANNVGFTLSGFERNSARNSICLRDYLFKGDGQGIIVDIESI